MHNRPTLLLNFYRFLTRLFAPFVPLILNYRVKRGKEDKLRSKERLGQSDKTRPTGKLIWFHGASVGESMVALSVANGLRELRPELQFLFTCQTLAGAQIIEASKGDHDIHQFAPVDTIGATSRFMNHWRPDLAIFVEGEIWPNLLDAARKIGIKTALINARMTISSLKTWLRFHKTAEYIFSDFTLIEPANALTKQGLLAIGAPTMGSLGNLKLAAKPPPIAPDIVKPLRAQISTRKVWLAASTHEGEDKLLIAAHEIVRSVYKDALLIIAPRHIRRAEMILLDCVKAGQKYARRSLGQKIDSYTSVYLWDTMGELGNAFAVSPISVIAGSFLPNIGGHNPIEPAQIGSVILSGPYVHNFADIYSQLEAENGAVLMHNIDPNLIALKLITLMSDEKMQSEMIQNAAKIIEGGKGAMGTTINGLLEILAGQK